MIDTFMKLYTKDREDFVACTTESQRLFLFLCEEMYFKTNKVTFPKSYYKTYMESVNIKPGLFYNSWKQLRDKGLVASVPKRKKLSPDDVYMINPFVISKTSGVKELEGLRREWEELYLDKL